MIFLFPLSECTHSILKGAVRARKLAGTISEIGTQMSSANTEDRRWRRWVWSRVCVPVPALAGMPETGKTGL